MKNKINYLLLIIGLFSINTAKADWIDKTTSLQWKPVIGQSALPDTSYRDATFDEVNSLVNTVVDKASATKFLVNFNFSPYPTTYSVGVGFNHSKFLSYDHNVSDANGNVWIVRNALTCSRFRGCETEFVTFYPYNLPPHFKKYGYHLRVKIATSDSDGDGVVDNQDNCINIANPNQADDDQDLFGDVCDADFDNNGIVNYNDVAIFYPLLQQGQAGLAGDFDQNGVTNFGDLVYMLGLNGQPPGPSGLIVTQ